MTDDLSATLAELRAIMADERRAIAKLDVDTLTALTARKQVLAGVLSAARSARAMLDPSLARELNATRVELGANAALLAAAREAVSAALGVESSPAGYGRSARTLVTSRPMRVVAY